MSQRLSLLSVRSSRDPLTALYNRRYFQEFLRDAPPQSERRRHGEPEKAIHALLLIDIDLFKRYNDEFDHLTGDRVLRTFAQAIQAGLRASDFFGRYGGEEFVQILPQTTLAGAMAHADRLRERISSLELPVSPSSGGLTVSIGVAQYLPSESIEQTFARADRALYKAKQRGRDRVEC